MSGETGSVDAGVLVAAALLGLLGWHVYQQDMLMRDQQRFNAFTQKASLAGVEFSSLIWPLPLPPRTDYGAQSNQLYSSAECALRRLLHQPAEEGLPSCP